MNSVSETFISKKRSTSLSRKVAWAACGLTGVLVLTLDFLGYVVTGDEIERNLVAGLNLKAGAVAQNIENKVTPVIRNMDGLSHNTLLANAITDTAERQIYLEPFLTDIQTINDLPVELALVDFTGDLIMANGPAAETLVDRHRTKIEDTVERASYQSFIIDIAGLPFFLGIQPLVLPRIKSAEGALVYQIPIPLSATKLPVVGDKPIVATLSLKQRRDGSERTWLSTNTTDEQAIRARSKINLPISHGSLAVNLIADRKLVEGPLNELAGLFVIAGLVTVIIVFAIALILTRRLMQPLKELEAVVSDVVDSGKLAQRVRVQTNDEIGRLGGTFNAMLDRIAHQQDTLEQQVAERTADLSKEVLIRQGAEEQVRALNKDLEARVAARTKALQDALSERQRAQSRLDDAQEIAGIGSWEWNEATSEFTCSHQLRRFVSPDKDIAIESFDSLIGFVTPADRARVRQQIDQALAGENPDNQVFSFTGLDGDMRWIEQSVSLDSDAPPGETVLQATMQDVTDRRHIEEDLRRLATVFESSGEGIIITDAENKILAVNAAFSAMTGYSLKDIKGRDPSLLSGGYTDPAVYDALWKSIEAEDHWAGELWDRRKSGDVFPVWSNISVVRAPSGSITNYIAAMSDISDKKEAEKHIYNLAHHDALTGLLNRMSLEERMEQALRTAKRSGDSMATMFIDLDRFKDVNDTLGHHVGDQLLDAVAERLRKNTRDCDIVARLGGDEFVIVLTGLRDNLTSVVMAKTILTQLSNRYMLDDQEIHTTPSIGISLYPGDGDSVDALLKNADTAMYHVKRNGRGFYQYFSQDMNEAMERRVALETDLRRALSDGQFSLAYQPQLDRYGHITGAEALIRWTHPERGSISPMEFIPIAEDIGLITDIGKWVLDEACRAAAAWRETIAEDFTISVNLSLKQLRDTGFISQVYTALSRRELPASALTLEITETQAMDNPDQTITILNRLRELGLSLAIDDFGTGYSSLAYLKRLPIQTLKLDRSFVKDIEKDLNDAEISAATLALAHSLGIAVCAEGVETEGQLGFLQDHHCDSYQGFLFSKPLNEGDFTALLNQSDRFTGVKSFGFRVIEGGPVL